MTAKRKRQYIISLLAIFSFAIFSLPAKADSAVYIDSYYLVDDDSKFSENGTERVFQFEVPDTCSNSMLMAINIERYYPVPSVKYNNVDFTKIWDEQIPPYNNRVFVLMSPSVGNNYLTYYNGKESPFSIVLFCNVDQNNPFYYEDYFKTSFAEDDNRIDGEMGIEAIYDSENLNEHFLLYLGNGDSQITPPPLDVYPFMSSLYSYKWNYFQMLSYNNNISYPVDNMFINSYDYNFYDYNQHQIYTFLNESSSSGGPSSGNYPINVYSDLVVANNNSNKGLSIPYIYDFCNDYANIDDVYLFYCHIYDETTDSCSQENYEIIPLKEKNNQPAQCKGTGLYQSNVPKYPISYFEDEKWKDENSAMKIAIAKNDNTIEYYTSAQFTTRVVNNLYVENDYIDWFGSPTVINIPLETESSQVSFVYNLENSNWNATSSKICLYNYDGNSIVENTCKNPISEKGVDLLILETPPTHFSQDFGIVYIEENEIILQAKNYIKIIWGEGLDYFNPWQPPKKTPEEKIEDDKLLICTAEEWLESDNENFFNLTRLKCNTLYSILKTTYTFVDRIETTTKKALENVFPINIPVNIISSYNKSKFAELPEDLTFLDITNEENALTGQFPKEWLGTNENLTFDIFSKDFASQGSQPAKKLFNDFKKFSVYLQWFIFIAILLAAANNIINLLTGKNNIEEIDNIKDDYKIDKIKNNFTKKNIYD